MTERRSGTLRKVDAVTIRVPSLDEGLTFYAGQLGHELKWRNDEIGQAGLSVPDAATEIVLTTEHRYEPNWLVDDVPAAVETFTHAGGTVVLEPQSIPVGRLAVVLDPFGNALVLLDLSTGTYATDEAGKVIGVTSGQ